MNTPAKNQPRQLTPERLAGIKAWAEQKPRAAGEAAHTLLDQSENCRLLCVNGSPVLSLMPADCGDELSPEAQALMGNIVRACNSHAALVAALENAVDALAFIRSLLPHSADTVMRKADRQEAVEACIHGEKLGRAALLGEITP